MNTFVYEANIRIKINQTLPVELPENPKDKMDKLIKEIMEQHYDENEANYELEITSTMEVI